MDIQIGAYDAETRTVSVTFTHGDAPFTRRVNAVLDAFGEYDQAATAARVDQVARGVAYKFEAGLIPIVTPESESVTPAAEVTPVVETAPAAGAGEVASDAEAATAADTAPAADAAPAADTTADTAPATDATDAAPAADATSGE